MNIKGRLSAFRKNSIDLLKFVCGSENGKVSRTGLWTMVATIVAIFLLALGYVQFQALNETTAAEFSHKIKEDLYNPRNLELITLFDDEVLLFKYNSDDEVWFELDTLAYSQLQSVNQEVPTVLKH